MLAEKNRAEENKELQQAVKSQLVDTSVTLVVVEVPKLPAGLPARLSLARTAAKKERAVAVFWYEQPGPGENYLFMVDPLGGRLLVRTVEPSASGGGAEAVAIIVRSSVRALLQGGRIGVKALIPAPRPKPRARPRPGPRPRGGPSESVPAFGTRPPSARRWLSLELSYAFESYATNEPALNGMWAGLSLHINRNWSFFAGYRFCQPMKIAAEFAVTRLRRHMVAVGARFRWPLGRFEIGGSAEVVLEYVENETDSVQGVQSSADRDDLILAAAPLLYFGYKVLRWLRITAYVGIEVPFNPQRYVVDGENVPEKVVLLDPWPVRPRAGLGVAVDLF